MRALPRFLNRRLAMTSLVVAGAALALAACDKGAGGAAAEGDMSLGAAEGATVTVIEYASVTCVHCAAWNQDVWPEFKAKYVDTNRIRYVFREFPTPPTEVAAAGFILARCAGKDHYFEVIDGIMRGLPEIQQGQARPVLLRVAQSVGISEEQFQTCVQNPDNIAAMEARARAAQDAGISGTPTFLVNGTRVQDFSMAGLSAAIDPLLGDAAPAPAPAAQPSQPAATTETTPAGQTTPATQPAA